MSVKRAGLHTLAIHAGEAPDPTTGAVAPPIYQSTAFVFPSAEAGAALFTGEGEGYIYTRLGNPTQAMLERKVAALEGGEAALATGSGMAAIATAMLTAVQPGGHLVSAQSIYSGTYALFTKDLPPLGIEMTLVDATDVANVARALRPNTQAIYIETPGNPTLDLIDITAVVEVARQAGVTVIMDNTFATPVNQRPLEMGVDVVVHSATKYFCGHGDAIAGMVVGPAEFVRRAREGVLRDFGGIISPFNAWLVLRGLQTLPLRMERHNANALQVARWLDGHPQVAWVRYPGLESHPQHELARRQMRGYGGMICFEVKGGVEAGRTLMNSLELCTLAVSLGDVRTLICHPASMTHASVPASARRATGITDGLVRLSVGLEDPEDIIADLEQALVEVGKGV